MKTDKIEANTPQAPKPPNYSRVQKPHNPRKTPKQYKHTRNKRNPLKTPLKCEIEPYSSIAHHKQSSRADKGRERTTKGPEPPPAGPEASKPCPPAPGGHDHRHHKRG